MLILILSILLQIPTSMQTHNTTISKNGKGIGWHFAENGDKIIFDVSSPSHGWVAIGINTENRLVGCNLIMASAADDHGVISDRYVVGLGDHQSMEDLGAVSTARLLSYSESESGTHVTMITDTDTDDQYHHRLRPGDTIYLTIANSHHDDFMHHSAMRTIVKINL